MTGDLTIGRSVPWTVGVMFLVALSAPLMATAQEAEARETIVRLSKAFQTACFSKDASGSVSVESCDAAIAEVERLIAEDRDNLNLRILLVSNYWQLSLLYRGLGISDDQREIWRVRGIKEARAVLDVDPNNVTVLGILERPGWDDEGFQALASARLRAMNPENPRYLMEDARTFMSKGNTVKSIEKLIDYLRVRRRWDHNDRRRAMFLAWRARQAGDLDSASRVYDVILSGAQQQGRHTICMLFNARTFSLASGQLPRETLQRVDQLLPYCTRDEHRERALKAEQAGDTEKAKMEWERQFRENPLIEDTYLHLPLIYEAAGEDQKAQEVVEKYFTVEKDTGYRCGMYGRMREKDFGRFAPDTMREVGEECAKWKAAGAKP